MTITPIQDAPHARRVRKLVQQGLDARLSPIHRPVQHCRFCGQLEPEQGRTVSHVARDIVAVDRARRILATDFGEASPYADRALTALRTELDTVLDAALPTGAEVAR